MSNKVAKPYVRLSCHLLEALLRIIQFTLNPKWHTLWNNRPIEQDKYCYAHVWQIANWSPAKWIWKTGSRVSGEAQLARQLGVKRHNWVCQRSGYTKGSAWNPTRNEVLPTKCPELVLHWLEFAPELLAFRTNKRAKRFIKSPGVDKTAETLSEQNSTYCWATAMHYTPGKALLDYLCFAIVCVWMCFLFCCVFLSLSLSLHLCYPRLSGQLPALLPDQQPQNDCIPAKNV